jgi:hypothetical protein
MARAPPRRHSVDGSGIELTGVIVGAAMETGPPYVGARDESPPYTLKIGPVEPSRLW